MLDAFGIEIAQDIGRPNSPLPIGGIDQRKEKIGRGNDKVPLSCLSHGAIEGDSSIRRSQILAIAQMQVCQHVLQFVLRNLAGSSFQGRPVRQLPTVRQANQGGVKIHRILFGRNRWNDRRRHDEEFEYEVDNEQTLTVVVGGAVVLMWLWLFWFPF